MNYLEQIKVEFPDVKPYSGDLDWENQAFDFLKEKNCDKAEVLFKKVCLSEPDHHSGFEGLAYVYYIKGEFEKAEWFMQEAVKRARKFLAEDAIDPEVIEEMEASYLSLLQREPLETAYGTFYPREADRLFSVDLEAWYKQASAATLERRWQMAMEALEEPLPFELLDEEDEDVKEDLWEQQRLEEFFFELVQQLRENKKMEKCRQFLEKFRSSQPALYRKDYHYYDRYLIEQALFLGEQERVKNYLDIFMEDPASGIDELIVVLQFLQFYGLRDLAEELSRKVCLKIRNAKNLIPGGEVYFEDTIFVSTMEKVYRRLQKGERPSLEEVNESLKEYELYAEAEIFDDILFHLSPGDDRQKIENLLQNEAGLCISRIFSLLYWQFCKYMLERRGMSFVTSYEIFHWFVKCFKQEEDDEEDNEEDVGGALSADFFAFPRQKFKRLILDLGGFLSNQWPRTAALIWGVPYIYDFLLDHGVISESCHKGVLEDIAKIKEEFAQDYSDRLWQFSFVHTWPLPDTAAEEERLAEKERFTKSFYEVTEKEKGAAAAESRKVERLLSEMLKPESKEMEKQKRAVQRKKLEKKKARRKEAKKKRREQRKKK